MAPDLVEFLRLVPLGFAVGTYGTLVGAGGGSLLVPALLILLPRESPATVTAISLAVVFFNAYAGTVAYMRMGRVDYRTAVMFTLASLPGAVLGAFLVRELPRGWFDPLFGFLLLLIGGYLVLHPMGTAEATKRGTAAAADPRRRARWGAVGSTYIAILASVLGIGGGIIHVPFLIRVLGQPAHIATATSHFVLTFMALAATVTHALLGGFERGLPQAMYLAVGVMMGAPLGAALSTRLHGSLIIRLLAVALALVGIRLLAHAW